MYHELRKQGTSQPAWARRAAAPCGPWRGGVEVRLRLEAERSAARLAHQSGGLGVPGSNPGAPTSVHCRMQRACAAPSTVATTTIQTMFGATTPKVREAVRPALPDSGETAQFLAAKKMILTSEARDRFLDCLYHGYTAAVRRLRGLASGDYSRDMYRDRFPRSEGTDSGVKSLHEAARVHRAGQRCGGCVAACSKCAAGDAGDRAPWQCNG
jgi:hypothetical protein